MDVILRVSSFSGSPSNRLFWSLKKKFFLIKRNYLAITSFSIISYIDSRNYINKNKLKQYLIIVLSNKNNSNNDNNVSMLLFFRICMRTFPPIKIMICWKLFLLAFLIFSGIFLQIAYIYQRNNKLTQYNIENDII